MVCDGYVINMDSIYATVGFAGSLCFPLSGLCACLIERVVVRECLFLFSIFFSWLRGRLEIITAEE